MMEPIHHLYLRLAIEIHPKSPYLHRTSKVRRRETWQSSFLNLQTP